MNHNHHNHHNHYHCMHPQIVYCGTCQVRYCTSCKQEWRTYTYPQITWNYHGISTTTKPIFSCAH